MTPAGVVDDYLGMLLSTAAEPAAPASRDDAVTSADASTADDAKTPPLQAADARAVTQASVEPAVAEAAPVAPAAEMTVAEPALEVDAQMAPPAPPAPAPVAAPIPRPPKPAAGPSAKSAPPAPQMPAPVARTPASASTAASAARAARPAPSAPGIAPPTPQRRAGERMARWLRLRCGEQVYALELLKIREVVLPSPLLPLRGAAPCLAGVMNLRGQVVPVVDLGLQLGGTAVDDTLSTRVIVLEDGGDVLGLRVTSVEDVVLIGDAQIEGTHTSRLAPVGDHRIRGIARLGGTVMLLLDSARLMALPLFQAR